MMNNKLELINALLNLSNQAAYVAKLLDNNILSELPNNTEIIQLPDTTKSINVQQFELWPTANDHYYDYNDWLETAKLQSRDIEFNICDSKILEYSNGPSIPIGFMFKNTHVDLICNEYKFSNSNPPNNVSIINSFEKSNGPYDIGIIYESLEFDINPVLTLLKMKQRIKANGKIFVRFRPWPSRDGGFQSRYLNKAFAHLLMDLGSNELIKNKITRPLAAYENFINHAKLSIISRKIKNIPPDDFIIENNEFMDVIIKRTWGSISKSDAIKIMTTTAIDFLLLVQK